MMSILFEPITLGDVEVRNRFVHSATYEGMATKAGAVTDALVTRYARLSRGEVGLIIPGGMHVHPLGKANIYQTGIDADDQIPGLKRLVEAVQGRGGRIVLQLMHGGA
jgi:2,4-dienoyl-CoA reductase-like NADH-dependent reductase (Old Yellow Enzyme family)